MTRMWKVVPNRRGGAVWRGGRLEGLGRGAAVPGPGYGPGAMGRVEHTLRREIG
jgi:hypothetical protein